MALIGNMSGSLTHLTDGKSYLVAGSGITLTSGSSGNITIASNAGSVAGSDTQFQFNNSDAFGGSDNLTFDGTNITVGAADGDAKLLFRDSAIYLQSSADGQLDIDADGEIEMASAKLDVDLSSDFNISGGAESTITTTAGALNITADANDSAVVIKGDHESGTAIQLDGNAATASVVDIDAGHLDIDASDKVTIDTAKEIELTTADSDGHITIHSAHTSGVAILIDANADAAAELDIDAGIVDIDAQGTFAVDATGISLDSDAASNFTTSTGALTLAGVTLDVDATGGAFNIAGTAASTMTTSGGALNLDGQTGVNIQEDGTTVIAIDTNRAVTIGSSVTLGSDVAVFISGSTGGSDRTVVGGDIFLSGTLRGGYNSESANFLLEGVADQIELSNPNGFDNDLTDPGSDSFLFVSGTIGSKGVAGSAGTAVFGGDVCVSGTQYNNTISAMKLSGSLTHLATGKSYLVAGSNITITSGSTGNVTIAASGGGDPAGSDTQFQYNNGGSFGGAADLTFNDSTGDVTVGTSTGDAKLQFRDSGNYIYSEGDGQLEIANTDGTSDQALNLTANAGGLVLECGKTGSGKLLLTASHAGGGIRLDAGTGDLDFNSDDAVTIDATGAVSIDAGAASNLSTSAGALTIDGAGGINIGTTSDVAIDIDSTTLDIDASGAITIDGTSTVSIQGAGATDLQTSSGALTLAGETLDIDATAGAFNIAGTGASTVTTSGGNLVLDGQTGVNIQENGTTVIQIDDDGTVDIGPSAASASGNGSDSTFFVSGSFTPAGMGSEITKARAVFGGDTVISGTIRGGYYSAAQTTMIKLKAGMTTVGAGTVGVTPALGGPGMDVSLFVSGSGNAARSANAPVALFGGRVVTSGSLMPGLDNQIDLGGSSNRWANIYTGDLHLKNDRGDWTVIEENDYLSLRNNKNGKMFKLVMEEITD